MATAIYAVIAPDHTTLALSYAGRLPPLMIDSSGTAITVKTPIDLPLGAYPNTPRHTSLTVLEPGNTMLLYTDGLVERRGELITDGIDRLHRLLSALEPDELCSTVIDGMLADAPATDDIAVLAIRRSGSEPS
jgi:phosphoserine phosphatase RsbU/P